MAIKTVSNGQVVGDAQMAFININYIRKEGREGCSCVLLSFFQDLGFDVSTMATN